MGSQGNERSDASNPLSLEATKTNDQRGGRSTVLLVVRRSRESGNNMYILLSGHVSHLDSKLDWRKLSTVVLPS